MKYSDFITLQDYFHPVFNLQNEAGGYWEKFIPANPFYNLFGKIIAAIGEEKELAGKALNVVIKKIK